MDEVEKYENERIALIAEINKDYDAKIAHFKKKKVTKEVTGDNDIAIDTIETGEAEAEPEVEK